MTGNLPKVSLHFSGGEVKAGVGRLTPILNQKRRRALNPVGRLNQFYDSAMTAGAERIYCDYPEHLVIYAIDARGQLPASFTAIGWKSHQGKSGRVGVS